MTNPDSSKLLEKWMVDRAALNDLALLLYRVGHENTIDGFFGKAKGERDEAVDYVNGWLAHPACPALVAKPDAVSVLRSVEWCWWQPGISNGERVEHKACPYCHGLMPGWSGCGFHCSTSEHGHTPVGDASKPENFCQLAAALAAEDSARTAGERIVVSISQAAEILSPGDSVRAIGLIATAIIADREQQAALSQSDQKVNG